MSASVSVLPIWKKDSTAAEWLQECAGMAMEYPERWENVVIVFGEPNEEGKITKLRHLSRGLPTNHAILGLLEWAKQEVFEYMKGRSE